MLNKIKEKIENKRNSENIFWRVFVYIKDIMWAFQIGFLNSVKVIENENIQESDERFLNKKIKILYLYDVKGWSYYNVGKYWLEGLSNVSVDFVNYNNFDKKELNKYDQVWYNSPLVYSDIPFSIRKSVFVVHGLNEISYQGFRWNLKNYFMFFYNPFLWVGVRQNLKLLKKAKNIIAISREIKYFLKSRNIDSCLINTGSRFSFIKKDKIKTTECRFVSILAFNKVKNPNLLKKLQEYCEDIGLIFELCIKNDDYIQPEEKYIRLLDNSEVYVCASFQEGGPLPAMEAMGRGAVVLATPVGQMLELIKDGDNGFICKTKEDFIEKINLLSGDLKLLHKMRIKSREIIGEKRNSSKIRERVIEFINECYLHS